MKKAKCWTACWKILRYGTLPVILVNTIILLREGNTILISLIGNQLGALMWLIHFISTFVLSITREYLKQSNSEVAKPSGTSEKQDNVLPNTAEEDSKQQKTE